MVLVTSAVGTDFTSPGTGKGHIDLATKLRQELRVYLNR